MTNRIVILGGGESGTGSAILAKKQGYEVLAVDSGSDCIEELKRGFKGIVLMDLIMPFMNGLDTLKRNFWRKLIKWELIIITR